MFLLKNQGKAKDGYLFPVEINANSLEYDGQGYNLALVRDSSKRKLAEEELHKLNKERKQRVRKRTAELAKKNAELQKMLRPSLAGKCEWWS